MLRYTTDFPAAEDLYELYENLGWNEFLQLPSEKLLLAMKQSWCSVYVYNDNLLVGTGRIISDGISNAYLCGLGVHSDFRKIGIGRTISTQLIDYCQANHLHTQLFCEEKLKSYYTSMGFKVFAIGMQLN